jgi:nonsense-mediated mRNA decay protein 3
LAAEFCVLCGRTGLRLEGGVCASCAADRTTLVELADHPVVILCPTCGSRKRGESWERTGEPEALLATDLQPFLRPREGATVAGLRFEEVGEDRILRKVAGTVALRFRDETRELPFRLQVRMDYRSCPECSRRSGRFYTAVIQLRGPEGRRRQSSVELREWLWKRWEAALPDARPTWLRAFSWSEPLKEGWDLYFTDTEAARAFARWLKRRLGSSLTESPSLWGRKDGKEVYRVTFCLRLPPLAATPGAAAA